MKKHFFFLLLLSMLPFFSSYAQGWKWARGSATGLTYSYSGIFEDAFFYTGPMCTDTFGNVFIAGYTGQATRTVFAGDTTYNPDSLRTQLIFYKLDTAGNLIFRLNGEFSDAVPLAITTTASGYSYFMGEYYDSTFRLGSAVLTNPEKFLMYFVAEIDPLGTVLWAKNIISNNDSVFYWWPGKLGLDTYGNLYVAGTFNKRSVVIGADTLINQDSIGVPGQHVLRTNAFVAKFDSAGNPHWARNIGGIKDDEMGALAVSPDGQVAVSGVYESQKLTIGSDTLSNAVNDSFQHTYIAKFDSLGNVVWTQNIYGIISPSDMAADDFGNYYFTGGFRQDTLSFGAYTFVNGGAVNYFLTKYNSAGNVIWAKTAGGAQNFGSSVSTDHCGNIWVAGIILNSTPLTMNFDGHLFSPTGLDNPFFIVSYDTSGNYFINLGQNNGGVDRSNIAVDHRGNFFVSGSYSYRPVYFASDTLYADSVAFMPYSAPEIYLAKFNYDSFQCYPYAFRLGVEEVTPKPSEITLFPNPAENELHVLSADKIRSVEIYNFLGQRIFVGNYFAKKITVPIADMLPGVYIVRVNNYTILKFQKE